MLTLAVFLEWELLSPFYRWKTEAEVIEPVSGKCGT